MQTFGASRAQGLGLELQGARDAEEDELLTTLEELAQKTEVLAKWADEMYDYVKAFPQSTFILRLSDVHRKLTFTGRCQSLSLIRTSS